MFRRASQSSVNNGNPSLTYGTINSGKCTWHAKSAVAKTKKGRNGQSGRTCCKSALKLTGRGYVCVLAENGPIWVPARWVRPWIEERTQKRGEPTKVQSKSPDATPPMVDDAT